MIPRWTDRTVAILVAAGQGSRTGSDLPKQFMPLGGRPMLWFSYRALAEHPDIDDILVVVGEGQEALLRQALGEVRSVIGGATRRQSVGNALAALLEEPPGRVLIHDAARPFLPQAVIDRVLRELSAYEGAIPGLPVADTLVRYDGMVGDTVPRDDLYRVQTPQAFNFAALVAAHRLWPEDQEATDDGQMVRDTGHEVNVVLGDPALEKITFPEDFARAEASLAARAVVRTGLGFDVHAFAVGEELWLGGVRIPHDKGLRGHSDADALLHAVTDAILGAIGAGDIGDHFPPSDPHWRGAPSSVFVEHARALVEARGGRLEHVDVTVICEAPRIGPHRQAMRERLASLLRLPFERVSIKATTTEQLGFTGRGEGLAAQAIATVRIWEDL